MPDFRFEVLPKRLDSRRQARCRDDARGNTERDGEEELKVSKKVAVQLMLQMMRPRTGVQLSAPTARKMPASATDMAIGGWLLDDLYLLQRIELKSPDMIHLPMSDA